jgi:hypothetical protein
MLAVMRHLKHGDRRSELGLQENQTDKWDLKNANCALHRHLYA